MNRIQFTCLLVAALLASFATAQDTTVAAETTTSVVLPTLPPDTTIAQPPATTEVPVLTTVAVPPETTVAVPPATTVAVPPETTVAAPPETTVAAPPETTVAVPPVTTVAQETTVAVPPVTTSVVVETTTAAPVLTTEAPVLTTEAPVVTTEAPAVTTQPPAPTSGGATCQSSCNCFCPAPATSCKDELAAVAATKCGRANLDTNVNMTQLDWLDLCDACLWYVKREWSTVCPQYDNYVAAMKADCRCVVRNEYACDNDGACSWDGSICRALTQYAEPQANENGEVAHGKCNCGGGITKPSRDHSSGRSCAHSASLQMSD